MSCNLNYKDSYYKDIKDGKGIVEENGVALFFEGPPVEDGEPVGTLDDLVREVVDIIIDDLDSGNLGTVEGE